MTERDLLAWLRDQDETLAELLGDDAAVLPPRTPSGSQIVTVDAQIEGVHIPLGLDPAITARRLLAVNLSDLAAMGAVPSWGFLTLATPAGFDHKRFFRSFLGAASKVNLALAGGDLARSERVHAALTLLGEVPEGGTPVLRSGARPGDQLWVGGTLGESAAGRWLLAAGASVSTARGAARAAILRHLLPTPQLELGRWLGSLGPESPAAALDLSDGLARDLPRLCEASGVDGEVDLALLPRSKDLDEICRDLKKDPAKLLTGGGEDYVLLFSLPPGIEPPAPFGCRRIGSVSEPRAETPRATLLYQGRPGAWPSPGWDHLE